MPKLPALTGNDLITILVKMGFRVARSKGSHFKMDCPDGRQTTIPVHRGKNVPKGLLRKIIREDLEITVDEFIDWMIKK